MNEEYKGELITSFNKAIFENIRDLGVDYSELGLDALTESEILKEVPFLSTVLRLGSIGISIRDRIFMKNVLIFIEQLNNGTLSEEEKEKHRKKLEHNPKHAKKELEVILIYLEKINHAEKSKMLSNIYIAYIREEINFDRMVAFVEILDSLLLYDMTELKKIYECYSYGENDYPDHAQLSRLSSLGLVQYFNGMTAVLSTNAISGKQKVARARISSEGKVFYSIITQGRIWLRNLWGSVATALFRA